LDLSNFGRNLIQSPNKMKVLGAEQIRAADRYTIKHEPIKSIDLMERAAEAFVLWFIGRYPVTSSIVVVCGTGNNGGDGLAIARILTSKGFNFQIVIVGDAKKSSKNFSINLKRANGEVPIIDFHSDLPFKSYDIVIDGIFGSGLNRPADGVPAAAIQKINEAEAEIIAIDIPSGLACDSKMGGGAIVKANTTVSFQVPKLSFLLPETGSYVNDWHVVDIGLNEKFIAETDSPYEALNPAFIRSKLEKRPKFFHKGDAGRALLVSGSLGKMGAAILASKACLKAGIGLLTVHCPKSGNSILQTTVPEAMLDLDSADNFISETKPIESYDIIGIGPGIGMHESTGDALRRYIEIAKTPMVIDADGLNILSENPEMLHRLPINSILTPHPGEFQRLAGPWSDDFERLSIQGYFSKKYNVILVLKNAHTSITSPDGQVYFNTTGNQGMATAGTGDVLTGIITALVGQGYSPLNSALLGVYVHGLSADLAKKTLTEYSITASDIINHLPKAFKVLNT